MPTKEESEEEEKEKFYRMLPGFDIEDRNDDILLGWTYGRGADYMETLTDEEIGLVSLDGVLGVCPLISDEELSLGLKQKMLDRPLGAKTWVGRSEFVLIFFYELFFLPVLSLWLIFLSFECFNTFFSSKKQFKKIIKKPTIDFKIFGPVAKGNTTSFFLMPYTVSISISAFCFYYTCIIDMGPRLETLQL